MVDATSRKIKRILVALDPSPFGLAALETSVSLAAELQAELVGLYVEDINLLYLAELPFSHEVRLVSAETHPITSRRVESAMQLQASRARKAFQKACAAAALVSSFRVVRGPVIPAVLAEAGSADLLILGRVSQPLTRRRRSGSTARAAAVRAPHSVLLAQQELPGSGGGILIVYDGSDLSRKGVETALSFASAETTLVVLLTDGQPAEVARWQKEINAMMSKRRPAVVFLRHQRGNIDTLIRKVREMACQLLVLSGANRLLADEAVERLFGETECSILIVRE